MTSFFPDLNVWLALSVRSHSHSGDAWNWMNLLARETKLIFSRYTQIGLLRLLTNKATLVTFDDALYRYARKRGNPAVKPA